MRRKIVDKGRKYKLVKTLKSETKAERLTDELEDRNYKLGKSRRFLPIIDVTNMPLFEGSRFHYRKYKVFVPIDWEI